MEKIAWIGVGVMGRRQAGRLAAAGYSVKAYSRRFEKVAAAAAAYGFIPVRTVAEAVADADVIFTMVGDPTDVEQVYLGEDGIFAHAKAGAITVDMTTSSPKLAVHLYHLGQEKGVHVLDAPVSGGDQGAAEGTLSIMVGGDQADFEQVAPLLQCMGKQVRRLGPAGAGQHTKVANQIGVAGATAAYTEAILYAERVGLDPAAMLEAIGGGAAGSWQIANMAPRALRGDLAPGFFVKHFVKDMDIAATECAERGFSLAMLETVRRLYQDMAAAGEGDLGTQALLAYYRKRITAQAATETKE